MNDKVAAMTAANVKTWARARKLSEHVEETGPNQARKFLAENKTGPYPKLLDGKKLDKRNPTVREMLEEFTEFCKHNTGRKSTNGEARFTPRPSLGDPTRTPRAGTPTLTRDDGAPIAPQTHLNLDGDTLIGLRKTVEEFGGIENLEEALRVLKGLQLK